MNLGRPDLVFKPDIVIAHGGDPDGFGSAWMLHRYVCPEAEFHLVDYGDKPVDIPAGKNVVLVDFTYSRDEMERMASQSNRFLAIDHHEPRFRDLAGLRYCVLDAEMSAIRLTQEHWGLPYNWLVEFIEIGDLWKWEKDPDHSRDVYAAITSYPFDFSVWNWLLDVHTTDDGKPSSRIVSEGRAIERFKATHVAMILDEAYEIDVAGHRVWAVNSPVLRSELGSELAKKGPFGAVWYKKKDGTLNFSLRSNVTEGQEGALDVSEIARKFGGNGHKPAAGFRTPGG